MDLNQNKLTKSEWDSIEIPISENEKQILKMIIDGYSNVNIRVNKHDSIFTYLKIDYSEKMEDYLYGKYLSERIDIIQEDLRKLFSDYIKINVVGNVKLNSADKIRLERNDLSNIKTEKIYEFIILEHIEMLIKYMVKNSIKMVTYHYYTLYKLLRNNVVRLNRHLITLTNKILEKFEEHIHMGTVIENAVEFIEKNESLLKYEDMMLYEHQKTIFTVCKNPNPKLVLYMAPTGTGKTLTPIALSEGKRIIFVCAARHVGLALARAAISMNKKIAFAFGCSSADDIRLHFFAAKEFTKNKKTGGIGKVDNSVGDDVEIIISDIKSYLPAMYYMLAFNNKENIIMYWDEPTITLDYSSHEFHKIIRNNWKKNLIPNIVLSSATLPKLNELTETISDFKRKFTNSEVYNIVSHDCKKSIPIINKDGYVILPHYLHDNYHDILKTALHCEEYLTLLRYFDLESVVEFISYINANKFTLGKMNVERYFETMDDINMKNIKTYYIKLLANIKPEYWSNIYEYLTFKRRPKLFLNETVDSKGNKIAKTNSIGPGIVVSSKSTTMQGAPLSRLSSEQFINSPNLNISNNGTAGVYITTKDAYTLTDGPTIFITNDVEKISKFCIQQANIPTLVMDEIMKKIEYNNIINSKLKDLENELEHAKNKIENIVKNDVHGSRSKSSKDIKKFNREIPDENLYVGKSSINRLTNDINSLRGMIKSAVLNDTFIPNKPLHIKKWADGLKTKNTFTSDIDENTVCDIMSLNGIEDSWKVLLMMGIGVFINHPNIAYTEIMKKLADSQKLYMIIATSDYIYGTNYQFCHGYLSKDLDLTQEKIIQAMGRVGRNNIQQNYSVRFRDDSQIMKLFTSETEKPEIINMNILFNSRKVEWDGRNYNSIASASDEDDDDTEEDILMQGRMRYSDEDEDEQDEEYEIV
jgi:hypothetical protein